MILDIHVHISACTPGCGSMSPRLLNSLPFKFMRWHFGLRGTDERTQRDLEALTVRTIDQTPELDAAVLLAFDAVYDTAGRRDNANTHLYVSNDYVIDLARRHRRIRFGASIHPYRKDAVAELERCVRAGAVLLKWLPITQNIDPADDRCIPFYEALAHHRLPLLSHTGGENALPRLNTAVADPMLLVPALKRGVRVIAAHCGTRSAPFQPSYLDAFLRLAQDYEHFYGDTAALNLPMRWYAYDAILNHPVVRGKLLHGSDWPIIVLPPPHRAGWRASGRFLAEPNWLRRDILIKRRLGLDDAYWRRAAQVLRLTPAP